MHRRYGAASLLQAVAPRAVPFSRGRLGRYIGDIRRVKSEEGRQNTEGEVVSRAKFQNGCCMHQIAHYTGFVPSDSNRGWHSRRFPMGSSIPLYFRSVKLAPPMRIFRKNPWHSFIHPLSTFVQRKISFVHPSKKSYGHIKKFISTPTDNEYFPLLFRCDTIVPQLVYMFVHTQESNY